MSDYLNKRREWILDGKPKPEKKKYTIPKVSKKKQAELALTKGEESELQKWFKKKMAENDKQCWNCGADLKKYNTKEWHACIAHVLPKAIFPSVATHPLNFMILGFYCNCHATYDSSWERAKGMGIWKEATERFVMIEPSIKERSKIPEVFLEFIKDPFE